MPYPVRATSLSGNFSWRCRCGGETGEVRRFKPSLVRIQKHQTAAKRKTHLAPQWIHDCEIEIVQPVITLRAAQLQLIAEPQVNREARVDPPGILPVPRIVHLSDRVASGLRRISGCARAEQQRGDCIAAARTVSTAAIGPEVAIPRLKVKFAELESVEFTCPASASNPNLILCAPRSLVTFTCRLCVFRASSSTREFPSCAYPSRRNWGIVFTSNWLTVEAGRPIFVPSRPRPGEICCSRKRPVPINKLTTHVGVGT